MKAPGAPTQKVSPAAMTALVEAVSSIYWYKKDLLRYLGQIVGQEIVARVDTSATKGEMVWALTTYMNERFSEHGEGLLELMVETSRFASFAHLERLDDGAAKVAKAKAAVAALGEYAGTYVAHVDDREKSADRRAQAAAQAAASQRTSDRLAELTTDFYGLTSMNPQKRGLQFERLLQDLFELYDLAPRSAFSLSGEQIDGYFNFEGSDFIVEAKWFNAPIQPHHLSVFKAKVENRIENTLGLFWSYSGFTPNAVELNSRRRSVIMLADGSDLMCPLENRISLPELLLAKRRHAAQTGNIFISATQILTG